ncbi:MFS transporter [Streptomyces sp. NPDC091281]|uniref:MFS transporter n=1 Tax=Streptomyces sp. NPDC091281 TaxID=3365985 RepID=UPI0038169C12
MPAYQDLFRTPEFKPLLLSSTAHLAAQTVAGLALATLVHRATGSPLLTATSMFAPSLAQVVGATFLLSASDRLPPRRTLTALSLAFAATTAALAVPGLPIPVLFLVVLAQGLVAAAGGGVRWGLLTEIVPKSAYITGRSLFNMSAGLTQITGYATAGALVTVLTPHQVLLLSTALHLTAAATAHTGLTPRAPRVTGRPSPSATWRTNTLLWSSRPRRLTYLGLWLPNGLIVGCEALYIPYAPDAAGLLLACAALGMLTGDITVGRLLAPATRARLATPLLLLLATPYLVFPLHPPLPVAAACVTLASTGFGATLIQQERLMSLTPPDLAGHALGLHSAGMLTLQGLSATLSGTLAQLTTPTTAMAVLALTSLTTTTALAMAARPTTTPNPTPRPH